MIDQDTKIFIAGAGGMVGGTVKRQLEEAGFTNIIRPTSQELNLIDQASVRIFFAREMPEAVVLCAGKVGGILANDTYRAEFIYDNLMIEANIIHAAYENGVKKLIFLGSSCIYPKLSDQPIPEEALLTGYLEPTNEPYAIAKIAGIKLCENFYRQYGCNFFSVMPTNLYGINDHFDLLNCHVIPALIRKIHEAKMNNSAEVLLWGTGTPRREFMYIDDLAAAVIFFLKTVEAGDIYHQGISHINIGTGEEIEIRQVAEMIKKIVSFEGAIVCDTTKPDGMPRKLLDIERLRQLGWRHSIGLEEGLRRTYEWFLQRSPAASDSHI